MPRRVRQPREHVRAIVGMDAVVEVGERNRAGRRQAADLAAARVGQHVVVVRHPRQGPELRDLERQARALLALAQLDLREPAFVDVGAGAHPLFHAAVGAPARHGPRGVPAVGQRRRVPQPGLDVDRPRVGQRVAPQGLHPLAILGVHRRAPPPAAIARGVLPGRRLPRFLRRREAAGGIGRPDDGHRRVHQRAVAVFTGPQPILGFVALGNVLDDGDEALGLAVAVEQRRHRHVHPHRRAVGAQVALVDGDLVHRATGRLLDQARVRRPVVRVGDLLAGEADGVLDRPADDVGHAAVHAREPAVERQQRDAERRLAEHRLEPRRLPPRLAVRGLAGAREGGDEQGDAGEDRRLRGVQHAPALGIGQRLVGVDRENRQRDRQQRGPEPAEPGGQNDGGERRRVGPRLAERQAGAEPDRGARQQQREGVAARIHVLAKRLHWLQAWHGRSWGLSRRPVMRAGRKSIAAPAPAPSPRRRRGSPRRCGRRSPSAGTPPRRGVAGG